MRDGARLALVVTTIAFALRLPFLAAGFGWDSDAWRVAAAAAAMTETGSYAAPRLPGNPVHDISAALLWAFAPAGRTPWIQNGASALVSALGAGAFALAWRRRGLPHALLAGVAMASVPAVFVASVSTLDYAWGFAFVAAALAAATHGKVLLAGAFAALAVGTRLPTLVCLPGLALFLHAAMPGEPRRGRRLVAFGALALVGGALPYLPLWLERGAGALAWYDHGYPPAWLVAKKLTIDLWGWIGTAALAVAGAATLAATPRAQAHAATAGRAAVASLLPIAAWLRLPYKAAYVVPATPFFGLALGAALPPRLLRPVLVALVIAPWFGSLYAPGKDDDPGPSALARAITIAGHPVVLDARGPILLDHARRVAGLAYVARIERALATLQPGSAVVVQDWLPHLRLALHRARGPVERNGVLCTHLLDRAALGVLRAEGRTLWTLPGTNEANRLKYGVDLAAAGACPLVP